VGCGVDINARVAVTEGFCRQPYGPLEAPRLRRRTVR
jgi:hypothetical protein